ncbi:MAG: ATP-binding cassette domain-containing protein [Enterocloster sp.]|uniref:ATP-binding cassette domain-containing protein n=1 Tax=Enterocloster sp. TaxID=2719315 RepID=UPI00399990FC
MALSGGQKQHRAVATALLSEKPVLIFDEPTSGLDYARMEVSGDGPGSGPTGPHRVWW